MSTNILMPALSPTMTEGKLSRWLKKEGDEVKSGDLLAEIETDKATMEVEAVDEGFLAKIVVPEGTEGVAVNAVIAVLSDTKGEAVAAPQATPAAPKAAATVGETPAPAVKTAPAPQPHAEDGGERVFASPLARRMAQQAGIDLSAIKGSGPNGRIVKADLETAPAKPAAAPIAAPVAAPAAALKPAPAALAPVITAPHKKIPNSSMRQTIARRLLESTQNTPTFFISANCEIDAMLKLRAELNAKSPKEGPGTFRLSLNDLIIKACAKALRVHPNINSSYTEEAMIAYDDVDISMAVAIPDGLITPIIRKADQLGLAAISKLTKDLGARAKAGKLKPEEYQGGSFAISNLGMYGVPSFTAIINPPQSAILAVGAGEKRAIVKDDAVVIAMMMTITLTCDHRVFDGAQSAEFMATLKDIIEDPLSLLL